MDNKTQEIIIRTLHRLDLEIVDLTLRVQKLEQQENRKVKQ